MELWPFPGHTVSPGFSCRLVLHPSSYWWALCLHEVVSPILECHRHVVRQNVFCVYVLMVLQSVQVVACMAASFPLQCFLRPSEYLATPPHRSESARCLALWWLLAFIFIIFFPLCSNTKNSLLAYETNVNNYKYKFKSSALKRLP